MKKGICLTAALVLFLVVGLTAAARPAAADTTVTYNTPNGTIAFDETTGTITEYSGTDTTLDIPSTIDGYAVTSIGEGVFNGRTGLTSIYIPSGVTSIGASAFNGCKGLTSIDIPSGVTSIGASAFYDCASLTSIDIPSGVTSIEEDEFECCYDLLSIDIPSSVTSIGDYAFDSCTLASADIPSGVKSIGDYAFAENPFTSVDIPGGVTSIGNGTFQGCDLLSIDIPSSVTSIGNSAFACNALTSVDIPSGVTSIGDDAFWCCTGLTYAYFDGNAPTTMGSDVFDATADNFVVYYLPASTGFPASWVTSGSYTYVKFDAPTTVTGISPSSGLAIGGTSVTITGTNLNGATAVNFGGTPANSLTVNSDTQITATSPAGTGTVDVTVVGPSVTSPTNSNDLFTYVAGPAPTLSGTPATSVGGTCIDLVFDKAMNNPSAYKGDFTVNVGGSTDTVTTAALATTTVTDDTIELTLTTPVAYGDTVSVSYYGTDVTSTDGGVLADFSDQAVTNDFPGSAPTVSCAATSTDGTCIDLVFDKAMNDPSAYKGDFTVTVSGSGDAVTAAFLDGSDSTNKTIELALTTAVTYGQRVTVSYSGTDVTSTDGGTLGTITDQSVTNDVPAGPVPTVSGINPTSGPAAGGTSVTITGTGFTGTTAVDFGAVAASVYTVDSDTQITATSPAGIGTVNITVTTLNGTSDTSSNDQYTYQTPAPTNGPSDLTATPVSPTEIDLSWDSMPDTVSYVVYRSKSTAADYMQIATPTTCSYHDTGLSPDTAYYYQVGVSDSVYSSVEARTESQIVAPTWPQDAVLTSSSITTDSAVLSWPAANGDVSGYEVYKNGSLLDTLGNVTTDAISGLTSGTSYTFQVYAGDSAGDWVAGPSATVTTIVVHTGGGGGGGIQSVTISLAPSTLPGTTVGTAYNQTITASGGTGPYTFAAANSSLPEGLGLSSSGLLSGTPTAAGTFTFTVTATDAMGHSGSASYTLTVAAASTQPTTSMQPAPSFSDVPAGYWAAGAIADLINKGIVTGYPDGTFKPDAAITRAEFATILVKALGLSTVGTNGAFMDVTPDNWCYSSVNAAVYAGLISGVGDYQFAPNALITREQMAVMVAKALGSVAPAVNGTELNAFSDKTSVDSWAVIGMEEAVKAGIVSGNAADTLDPLANATRAQAAEMIYKLLATWKRVSIPTSPVNAC